MGAREELTILRDQLPLGATVSQGLVDDLIASLTDAGGINAEEAIGALIGAVVALEEKVARLLGAGA